MLARTLYLSVFLFLCFTSCKKHIDEPARTPTPGQPAASKLFEPCNCSADSTEYIKGVFNDVPICFNTQMVFPDSFGNAYYYKAGVQDQLNMIRQNATATLACEFFFSGSNMHSRALPYVMPHPDLGYCEHVEMTLLDFSQPWFQQCQGCSTDNADYFGDTWHNLSVTVTDTT